MASVGDEDDVQNLPKKSANFLDLSSMIPNVPSEFLEKVVIWTTLMSIAIILWFWFTGINGIDKIRS